MAHPGDPDVTATLNDIALRTYGLVDVGATVLLVVAGVGILRTRVPPRRLGVLPLVAAVPAGIDAALGVATHRAPVRGVRTGRHGDDHPRLPGPGARELDHDAARGTVIEPV